MARGTLHEQLIALACKTHGWNVGPWKKAFINKCKENPFWEGEMSGDTTDDGEQVESAIREVLRQVWPNPDAWRLVVEGKTEGWGYDVLVLEFLEVEVTNGISEEKRDAYEYYWWQFDGSSQSHFRVYHMDRFGIVRPYMTEGTIFNKAVEIHIRPETN